MPDPAAANFAVIAATSAAAAAAVAAAAAAGVVVVVVVVVDVAVGGSRCRCCWGFCGGHCGSLVVPADALHHASLLSLSRAASNPYHGFIVSILLCLTALWSCQNLPGTFSLSHVFWAVGPCLENVGCLSFVSSVRNLSRWIPVVCSAVADESESRTMRQLLLHIAGSFRVDALVKLFNP